jgi:hypothetical protein
MSHRETKEEEAEDKEWDTQFNARLEESIRTAQTKLVMFKRLAIITTFAFFLNCAAIVPFLYGHSLHNHWESIGKYLVMIEMVLLPACLFCCAGAYINWYSIRGTRKIQQM